MTVATYDAAVAPRVRTQGRPARPASATSAPTCAIAASAASGTKTTTAWMTSGWSGIPLSSMPDSVWRRRPDPLLSIGARTSRSSACRVRGTAAYGLGLTCAACRPTTPTTSGSPTCWPTTPTPRRTARFKALDLHVMTKPDLTPVTDADQSVEEGIRRVLSRARPRDAVHGEETGSTGHSQRRWVVDPIDGTKNFVRGVPVWASLISLMVDDEVVVGVVSAPALNRRWWAMKDGGAWTGKSLLRATACQVSDVSRRRGRLAVLQLAARMGRARPARGLHVAVPALLAHPGVRRLLVLHARRRRGRRHRRRAGAARATTWPPST